ncbi:MAG: photosynthetic complex putative assembly protein PuhB [Alphaproteobacteria bacterium]|nr:photosynthetic complex putative assembly protein PuhB [Alphaproteobacteria bacterium]
MCDPDTIKEEPIPGLPDYLPEGEHILWRGSPDWRALAMHVFHVRAVAIYFILLLVWQVGTAVMNGAAPNVALAERLTLVPMAAFTIGLLGLLAWLFARSTIYTITNERVVIRAGVALPKAINIPFTIVETAGLNLRKSGNGDIALSLVKSERALYLPLWPHARPWKITRAEPMLRGLSEAADVAEILAGALAEKAGQPATRIVIADAQPIAARSAPARAAALNS